jgi:pilus assembly protein CpaB
MDRNKRTAAVVLVAVILAAVASLGMYRVVAARPASEDSAVKTVDVVVAQHPLALGTLLTKGDVKLVKWPADTQVPGAFAKVDEVLDRGLIATVEENELLIAAKVAPREAGAGLPPSIPQGMRAISVKVNEVIGVAGFVVPGTRVDVMVTLANRQAQQESVTRVVVSNVQVLTAGTRIDQENAKDGKPIPSTVVTLLVSPEDGERIALAASEGQVMLTLRNPLDTSAAMTSGTRTAALLGQPAEAAPATPRAPRASAPATPVQPEPAVAAAPAPAAKIYTIEAIRGAKRSEEIVR